MIAATAKTIPKTYASLADVGFSAMRPLLARPGTRPDTVRRANKCVSYVTLRWDIIPHLGAARAPSVQKTAIDSRNRHWLEYDSVALVVLFVGIGFVALIVLGI